MKKRATIGIAAILTATSFTPTVWAGPSEQVNVKNVLQEHKDESFNIASENEEFINTLSLDEAIEVALNNDFSLMKIKLGFDQLNSAINSMSHNRSDLREAIGELEDQVNVIEEKLKELEHIPEEDDDSGSDDGNGDEDKADEDAAEKDKLKEDLQEARAELKGKIEELQDLLNNLAESIAELDSQRKVNVLNQEQLEEVMKLTTVSTFTSLNMMKDQIDFMKQSTKVQQKQVHISKRQYEVGLISRRDYETTKREQTKLESQIEQLEKQYTHDLATFAMDIGIMYHPDLTLEKQELGNLRRIEQKLPTDKIIEDSFQMKQAQENLALARTKRGLAYGDNNAHSYDREQADIAVTLELLNIEELEVTLENAIQNLYHQISQQYEAVLDAEDDIIYAEEDVKDMTIRYEVGLISKAEYELAAVNIEQAKFNYEMEKYNYYLLLKQEELLESGVIPTN